MNLLQSKRGRARLFACLYLSEGAPIGFISWALAFALISAAAFAAAGTLGGPFLVDREVPKETIGFFFAVPAVVATLVGGMSGGTISDRFGRIPSVAVSMIGFVTIGAGPIDWRPRDWALFDTVSIQR